jgi:hypothetical protein
LTSSGTYNFSLSNSNLSLASYERIQIRAPELRQEHMVSAYREMNLLLSRWSNQTPALWKVVRTQTILTAGTATYTLPQYQTIILDASIVLNFGGSNESRRYITPISRTEYLSYANQQAQGAPTVFWADRLITPTVTFYPVPDGGGPYTFDYFSVYQMQDANLAGGETPDIPYRWYDAMIADLAHRLSRIYAPNLEQLRKLDAKEAWDIAAAQDTENVPLTLAPDLSSYFRP